MRDWKVFNPLWPRENQTYFSKFIRKELGFGWSRWNR